MAVATVVVLVVTTVVLANADSPNVSDKWYSRAKITTLSAVPASTTALNAQWQPMTWAVSYDLTYSGTNVPNPVLVRGITSPTKQIGSLSRGGTYSVRVRPVRRGLVGPWSQSKQVTLPLSEPTPTTTAPPTTTSAPTTTSDRQRQRQRQPRRPRHHQRRQRRRRPRHQRLPRRPQRRRRPQHRRQRSVESQPSVCRASLSMPAFCETFDAPKGGGTRYW